ncbi:MAG TPA: hypothetical protein DCS89_14865 [Gammaproteobacteria bacterium]|nr:hypothetical protein [Gammaproteobacteria bacterium]|tara:strand:- start:1428 stop:2447 length:1020 start_codon:yes stop_codon:yes gene_type:complete
MNLRNSSTAGWVTFLFLGLGSPAQADRLFESLEPMEISLSGPLIKIRKERDKSESYKATLGTGEDNFDVELRVRGNKRLDAEVCRYPPLRIEFEPEGIKKTLFAHQERLKLVVLCKDTAAYRDYLRAEFLIYRMFNLLTPLSYNVRWLKVSYSDEKGKVRQEPAFFIERKSRLAKRNNLETTNVGRILRSELEPDSSALVGLFQYMVSNADYSLVASADDSCCHNAKILRGEDSLYRPVIYDFDSSGLVNASYATGIPSLKIKRVTQRLYRGYCAHNSQVSEARRQMLSMREALLDLLRTDTVLGKRSLKQKVKYFTKSLEMIADDEVWQEKVLDACRG